MEKMGGWGGNQMTPWKPGWVSFFHRRGYLFLPFKAVTIKKREAILFQDYRQEMLASMVSKLYKTETIQPLGTASIKPDLIKRRRKKVNSSGEEAS